MNTTYRDLAEFGLPFVTPQEPGFQELADEIRNRPSPFPRGPEGGLDGAAVLLNQSGKIVVSLSALFRYKTVDGQGGTNDCWNVNASLVIDVLMGLAPPAPDHPTFIFPGSKRLITANGIWGDNTDVVPRRDTRGGVGGGFAMAGGGGRLAGLVSSELQIDLAIFEDGLCAGPDESGKFPALIADLEKRRFTAAEALEALRGGASRGQLFELLRPIARHGPSPAPSHHPPFILRSFADMAIRNLVNLEDAALLSWFERAARPTALELRRPS